MIFIINSLKKSIPFVIKAIPEIKIEGKWLSEHIDNCITSLNSVGYNVCAIISDNHSTNALALVIYLTCMEMRIKVETLLIINPIQPTISICFLIQWIYWKTLVTIYLTHRELIFYLLNLIRFSVLLMYQREKKVGSCFVKFTFRTINYQPIWKKHLRCCIKQYIWT